MAEKQTAARRPNDTRHPEPAKALGQPVAAHVPVEGFQAFPSVRYHKSGTTKTIHSREEHDELMADENWAESPADFEK